MKRSREIVLPPVRLQRESRQPLHLQLAAELRRAISAGAVTERLPASRVLARHLHLSRNTVLAAYEDLRKDGIVDSRRGSGTWRRAAATGLLKRTDLMRGSHYPFGAHDFCDPDGHPLYFHR